jgi:DNA polymerase III subunit gamma/tau
VSSATSLYRRHRPRTFADMVGQEPVVRTLSNAVTQGKVHHAYLFVGSRGTGKTSTAKILAACLNCERGPTAEPCGSCDSCRSIAKATSLDVIEMDAASNNSVDDIRELRESVVFAPVSGRHKVYILDEAHMLSGPAWNAFLKTLEEPPPNTVFVLATTEAQKVLPTVVDRCHRFDFQRPTVEQLTVVLRRAAAAEQIEIPAAALSAIARAATGSFRDALGTLEQLVTYSGKQVTLEDALAVLGVVDSELLAETFEAIDTGDPARVLRAVASCMQSGRDAGTFATDLERRARDLLVCQTLGEVPAELSLTPVEDERLAKQASSLSQTAVLRVLELLASATETMRAGADSRTQLELALVKAASLKLDASTTALLARIERLESALAGSQAGQPEDSSGESERQGEPSAAQQSAPSRNGEVSLSAGGSAGESERHQSANGEVHSAPTVRAPVQEEAISAVDPPPAQSAGADEDSSPPVLAGDLVSFSALWPAIVQSLQAEHGLLGALIAEAKPVGLDDEDLTLAFAESAAFLKKKAEDPRNRTIIMAAIHQITGRRLRPTYELRGDLSPPGDRGVDPAGEDELLARLMAEFDAEELPSESPSQ